jgi:hypothetical protein
MLRRVQFQAASINADLAETKDQVADALRLFQSVERKISAHNYLRKFVDVIENNLPADRSVDGITSRRLQDFEETALHQRLKSDNLLEDDLAALNFYVKQSTRNLELTHSAWDDVVDRAEELELLIAAEHGEPVARDGRLRRFV